MNTPAPTKKTCGLCKFFTRDPANMKQGNCLRYPPILCMVAGPGGQLGKFSGYPEVKDVTPACGEYLAAALPGLG